MANERFLIGNHFSSVSRQARPSLSPNRSSTRKTSWLRPDGTIDGICKLRWIGLGDANTRSEPARLSYEQLGAGQGELHIGAALVEPQPAAFDREVETGIVLGRGAARFVQERPVEQLDVNAAVLHRFYGIRDFSIGFCAAASESALGRGSMNFMKLPTHAQTTLLRAVSRLSITFLLSALQCQGCAQHRG